MSRQNKEIPFTKFPFNLRATKYTTKLNKKYYTEENRTSTSGMRCRIARIKVDHSISTEICFRKIAILVEFRVCLNVILFTSRFFAFFTVFDFSFVLFQDNNTSLKHAPCHAYRV